MSRSIPTAYICEFGVKAVSRHILSYFIILSFEGTLNASCGGREALNSAGIGGTVQKTEGMVRVDIFFLLYRTQQCQSSKLVFRYGLPFVIRTHNGKQDFVAGKGLRRPKTRGAA